MVAISGTHMVYREPTQLNLPGVTTTRYAIIKKSSGLTPMQINKMWEAFRSSTHFTYRIRIGFKPKGLHENDY